MVVGDHHHVLGYVRDKSRIHHVSTLGLLEEDLPDKAVHIPSVSLGIRERRPRGCQGERIGEGSLDIGKIDHPKQAQAKSELADQFGRGPKLLPIALLLTL